MIRSTFDHENYSYQFYKFVTPILMISNIFSFFIILIEATESISFILNSIPIMILTYCFHTSIKTRTNKIVILDFFTMVLLLMLCGNTFDDAEYLEIKITNIISDIFLLICIRSYKHSEIVIVNNREDLNSTIEIDEIFINNYINEEIEEESLDEICVICQEKMKSDYIKTNCYHYFHRECFKEWLKVKIECPLCKNDFKIEKDGDII